MTTTVAESARLLRMPEVVKLTGLSREGVYKAIKTNDFPRPRKITKRASAFRSDEVQAWIDSRPVANVGRRQHESRSAA
jgi:prophage regulatory protein